MAVYDLYLESGPKRRRTMVHVPALLGCTANGPTTDVALDATPEAVQAFRRFLVRSGEAVDTDDTVDLAVVEHIMTGQMLGDGSPYISFTVDADPVSPDLIESSVSRLSAMFGELATWAATRPDAGLDLEPSSGRTAREILLHVMGGQGAALSIALGSAPGFGAIHGAANRGERPIPVALLEVAGLAAGQLRATTEQQRCQTRVVASGSYTLRKAIRGSLEHAWNHLAELGRRPGGPSL